MKTTFTRASIIRPAEPTWNGVMTLSELDQVGAVSHVPTIYFYSPPPADTDFYRTVSSSLSEVLVYFYPLAGRLRRLDGGRLEIDCNANGAPVVEVEYDCDMEELGYLTPSPEFYDLLPKIDYSLPIEEIPILLVQVTKFRCGGVSLGVMTSHAVFDGQSAFHFTTEWARMARGEPIEQPPFLDRRILRAGEPPLTQPRSDPLAYSTPPLIIGETTTEKEKKKETTFAIIKISDAQVQTLKNRANENWTENKNCPRPYTRFEVIAAQIFRSSCRARRHVYNQPTGLAITVDVRNRMNPRLPSKFFGNAVVDVVVEAISGEVVENQLSFTAGKIRETIQGVTCDYVNSTIDYLKCLEDLSPLQDFPKNDGEEPFYGNPVMGVVSWIGLPLGGMDFGFGKEIYMAPDLGALDPDGNSRIIPALDGGIEVAVCMHTECMADFKKFFYEDM